MKELEYYLNSLWASTILECNLDFSKCKLALLLDLRDNGVSTRHRVEVLEIDFFCFSDELKSAKSGIPIFMELTTISSTKEKTLVTIEYCNSSDTEKYFCRPNLLMEISDAVFLISANQIQVDDKCFNLR